MRFKKSARTLSLAVIAALGLMAVMAVGAQANWLVLHNGVIVEPEVTINLSAHTELKVLVKEETNLEILCATVKSSATNPVTLLAAKTVAHGKLETSTCKTWQGAKEKPGCKPIEPIVAGGLVLIVLHNGRNYLLYEPDPGVEEFAVVKFNGGTCALPEKNKITGELIFECGDLEGGGGGWTPLDCKNHEVTHLLREAPEDGTMLFEHKLKYGTKKALIDGIVAASISSPALYVGDAWGGHI